MTRTIFIAAALALAVTLPAIPAQAQADRTFVSAAGSDSNNCTNVATPCRHFAAAYAATAAEGEIDVLDPANYGELTISQGISVQGHGWASVSAVTGGAAITINGGDTINISGVILDGGGAIGNGIVFNSGGSLTVTDSVVRNFSYKYSPGITTGNGIAMKPTSDTFSFAITNTIVSNNGYSGILYFPQSGSATANGVIDHVVATNNAFGIQIATGNSGSSTVAISNSIASNNNTDGIYVGSGSAPLAVSIDNTSISGNGTGITINTSNTPSVFLGRSVITANSLYGINNTTSTFYSYQDNRINGNGTGTADDVTGTALNHGYSLQ